MPRKLEDVIALRDMSSGKMCCVMIEIEALLYRNKHMCYVSNEIKVAVDYPDYSLPLSFVLHAMVSKDAWSVEMPVKGWYRSSKWDESL